MSVNFEIEQDFIAEQNRAGSDWLAEDFEYLGKRLRRLLLRQWQIGGLVHDVTSRAQTLTALSGTASTGRVSSQKRCNRFCATCMR